MLTIGAADSSGRPVVIHTAPSPTVYLDKCVLTDVAENPGLRRRLADAIIRRGGTLCLSCVHLAEFANTTVASTAEAVEGLLLDLDRNVAFLDVRPKTVIDRENNSSPVSAGGRAGIEPHLDDNLVAAIHQRSVGVDPLDLRGLFRMVQGSAGVELLSEIGREDDLTLASIQRGRALAHIDPAILRRIRRPPSAPARRMPTEDVFREITRQLLRDKTARLGPQDMRDLFHMIVPVSYLDYVVLDGGWAYRAEEIRKRLEKAGTLTRFARIYSPRQRAKRTMKQFWRDLESEE